MRAAAGRILCTLLLALVASVAFATRMVMTVPVEGTVVIPDGTIPSNYQLTLNGNQHTTMCRADGGGRPSS